MELNRCSLWLLVCKEAFQCSPCAPVPSLLFPAITIHTISGRGHRTLQSLMESCDAMLQWWRGEVGERGGRAVEPAAIMASGPSGM